VVNTSCCEYMRSLKRRFEKKANLGAFMAQKFDGLIPVSSASGRATILSVARWLTRRRQCRSQGTTHGAIQLVKMGSDTSGYSVVEKGTLLAIQKGGILAVPTRIRTFSPTSMKVGQFHAPGGLSLRDGNPSWEVWYGTATALSRGRPKCIMKIDVNVAKNRNS